MIEEQARVIAVDEGSAWVETQRQSSCGQCSANKGCGTAVLSNVLGQKRNQIRVIDRVGVKPGETVVLGLEEAAMLKGSLLVYISPLFSLFFFASLAQLILRPQAEWPVIIAGLVGLGLGFWFLKRRSRDLSKDSRFQAVVLRRVIPVRSSIDGVFSP